MICLKCIFKALPSDLRTRAQLVTNSTLESFTRLPAPHLLLVSHGSSFSVPGCGCNQSQPALALLPGLLSIPPADLWQPRWRGDKGKQPRVVEKKGDIEKAALLSPEGWTSETCARINAFFNKDIFFS